MVATDLMRRGFDVFRALSPAAPYDLMAQDRSGRMLRVEVRTATRHVTSRQVVWHVGKDATSKFDLFGLAFHSGEVRYVPAAMRPGIFVEAPAEDALEAWASR